MFGNVTQRRAGKQDLGLSPFYLTNGSPTSPDVSGGLGKEAGLRSCEEMELEHPMLRLFSSATLKPIKETIAWVFRLGSDSE